MTRGRTKLAGPLAALVFASAAGLYAFWPERSPLPKKTPFICVETGQVFFLSTSDLPLLFPAKNPRTGRATLLPAELRPDRSFAVMSRYARPLLGDPNSELGRSNRYVDPNTFELLASPRQP